MAKELKIKLKKKPDKIPEELSEQDVYFSLGELIHIRMKGEGLTAKELAAQLSIQTGVEMSSARMYRIFEDRATLPFDHLCILLDLVKVSDADLGRCRRGMAYLHKMKEEVKKKTE